MSLPPFLFLLSWILISYMVNRQENQTDCEKINAQPAFFLGRIISPYMWLGVGNVINP